MYKTMTDNDITAEQVKHVARKWFIPRSEALRLLRNND